MLSRSCSVGWRSLGRSVRKRCMPTTKKRSASTSAVPLSDAPGTRSFPGIGSLASIPQPDQVFEYRKSAVEGTMDFQAMFLHNYKQFGGKLWTYGLPGVGKDMYGTVVVVSDPHEYMKVLRSETSKDTPYPFGAVQMIWPAKKYYERTTSQFEGQTEASYLLRRDSNWQTIRHFFQKDFQMAKDARSYIPVVARAAELASKGAPANSGDFMNFLHRTSFDMFSATMFGSQSETADMTTPSLARDLVYSRAAERVISMAGEMMIQPMDILTNEVLGMQSKNHKEYTENVDLTFEILNEKVAAFEARWDSGDLDEHERLSYLARCLDRRKTNEVVTHSMLVGSMWALLTASVDTTSTLTAWVLVQLACDQEAQERLLEELQAEGMAGAGLTPEVASRGRGKWLPYFHNVIRESHRMRPAMFPSLLKETATDLEIQGVSIPGGTTVFCDTFAPQNDPSLVEDPGTFRPERWSPDAVKARRGTAAEVIDHPLLRNGFSSGARKCPGATVANFEMMSLVSRLVQDYKFSFEDKNICSMYDVPYKQTTTNQPTPFPALSFQPRKAGM